MFCYQVLLILQSQPKISAGFGFCFDSGDNSAVLRGLPKSKQIVVATTSLLAFVLYETHGCDVSRCVRTKRSRIAQPMLTTSTSRGPFMFIYAWSPLWLFIYFVLAKLCFNFASSLRQNKTNIKYIGRPNTGLVWAPCGARWCPMGFQGRSMAYMGYTRAHDPCPWNPWAPDTQSPSSHVAHGTQIGAHAHQNPCGHGQTTKQRAPIQGPMDIRTHETHGTHGTNWGPCLGTVFWLPQGGLQRR